MTALNKKVGAPFENEEAIVRVSYDVARDGGATGDIVAFEADGEVMLTGFHAKVGTAFVGATATLKLGTESAAEALVTSKNAAALTANTVLRSLLGTGTPNTETLPIRLADGDKIIVKRETAAFTAGRLDMVFKVMK